jgi:tetratricopeptide (TPR) repeat protein
MMGRMLRAAFRARFVLWFAAALSCGGGALSHGGLHEQIAALTRRIEREPADATLWLRRAELWRLDGDAERALADLERAAAREATLAGLELERGRILLAMGCGEAAEQVFDRILAVQPEQAEALELRGGLRAQRGALEPALEDYDRLARTARSPKPEYFLARAEIAAALRARNPEAAGAPDSSGAMGPIWGLDEGLARIGPCAVLSERALELELASRRFDEALARLDTLARSSERQETWLGRRAAIELAADRTVDALASLRSSLGCIERLPPRLRSARSVQQLEASVRTDLRRLTEPAPVEQAPAPRPTPP